MTNRAGSIVAWSSYNYPVDISANDVTGYEDVQFSYGPDRQRWKQIYEGPSATEITYYVGGLLEKVFISGASSYRHYVYAGKEPVAVYTRTPPKSTMTYVLEDHEGSVSNIASNIGASDVNESFSAFGTRRNPSTWSGAPTTADLNTIAGLSRQGYTFQTWLGQSMGLNHMNGRVEDAILGRFLSPDPHVPDPSNAQSYNRYSYVNNNPLTFTDPTGFCTQYTQPAVKGLASGGGCLDMGSSVGDLAGASASGDYGFYATGITDDLQQLTDSVNAMASAAMDAVNNAVANAFNAAVAAEGVAVYLPDGSFVADPTSPTGLLMAPTSDLAPVAQAGQAAASNYSWLGPILGTAAEIVQLGIDVSQGGTFDYQRSDTGPLPQFVNVSNFNVGLEAQQMGLSLPTVLAIAGAYALASSSNSSVFSPYGLSNSQYTWISVGWNSGNSGVYEPPGH
jgi:RHS repeat-associated protein